MITKKVQKSNQIKKIKFKIFNFKIYKKKYRQFKTKRITKIILKSYLLIKVVLLFMKTLMN